MEYYKNIEKELPNEIWIKCKEADNYEVSNLGRLRCLSWINGSNCNKEDYPRIIPQRICNKGYCNATMVNNNGKNISVRIHRYVAYAFISNPSNLSNIHHYDGNKYNNMIENLEWISLDEYKIKNNKLIFGVGYSSERYFKSRVDGLHTKEYTVWYCMLNRCYNKNNINYFRYGGNGVIVDKRWHDFQNFCKDITEIENYNSWKNNKGWALDKDIKQVGIISKIYSKETCIFITNGDNSRDALKRVNNKNILYIGTRLSDNYFETFDNQCQFAKKYNLHQTGISACVIGDRKTHGGWVFKIYTA